MALKYSVSETVLLKAGEYRVKLNSIDEVESNFSDTGQLMWTFCLVDQPHAGMEVTGYTSLKMTRGLNESKAIRWATILSGRPVLEFDGEQLFGKEAIATIIPRESKTDSSRKRNHLDGLAPVGK